MKAIISAVLILIANPSFGQKKECDCKSEPKMKEYTTDCKTTFLKNGSKLYWQFNCNRVWLTLESAKGRKRVLNEVPVDLSGYTYRLGYQLSKEYKNTLLFRSGCPANGPCNFVLIDKTTGIKLREFGELIYDHSSHNFYDFVLYLYSPNTLIIYYIDTGRKYTIRLNGELKGLIPEYQFSDIIVNQNTLTLIYTTGETKVNLSKYHP
ncbi:hypothetical protein MUN82_11445 [Hymenobacter aerilatus]|uniref:Uncharacterized protein n=1 Tax=Hymenobacter aerilatus TaxID=2932251 RepID=A0A8T9SQE0_9BACT|nr:hypothetical protein [Hymenobacter aerilatus]UOR03561.1 hypothetical protein MUN82_11445 [Hymenobacter aerilatus]